MIPVADQLRHHMRAVCRRAHNTRSTVSHLRHRIEQMHRMIRPRCKRRHRRVIICVRVCQRHLHQSLNLTDIRRIIRVLLRCQSDDLHQSLRGFHKLPADPRAAGKNVLLILRTLLHMTDKRTLHIDPDQIRPLR